MLLLVHLRGVVSSWSAWDDVVHHDTMVYDQSRPRVGGSVVMLYTGRVV